MDRVVVSVDGSPASKAAVQWCAEHLEAGTTVIAVCGMSELGEFVVSMPPFDVSSSGARIEECFRAEWCAPLREAGLRCEPRFVHCVQASALAETVKLEQPDALVIGKPAHHAVAELILGRGLDRLLHRPPCPIVLVPVEASGRRHAPATSQAQLSLEVLPGRYERSVQPAIREARGLGSARAFD